MVELGLQRRTEPNEPLAKVQWYSEKLVLEAAQFIDLDIASPTRRVIHAGPLFRQNDSLKRSVSGWKELWVVLFDNYFIMTKPKGKGDDLKYVVWRSPVRLEFLALSTHAVRPVQRSNTLSRMMRSGRDSPDRPITVLGHAFDNVQASDNYYPLSLQAHGKHGGSYMLYASTLDERNEWRRTLQGAIGACMAAQEETSVFRLETITADTMTSQDAPAHQPGLVTGRISCSLPFTSSDGRDLIALGSEDGVWIGLPHQPESIQRVMSLKLVTQLGFLAQHGFMIVLADSIVYAVDIESIVPTNRPHTGDTPALQMLSKDGKQVQYFSVGRQAGRTLISLKGKKSLDSVFHVLEVRPSGTLGSKREFRVFCEFFLPSDTYDVLFLKTKVCILCPRGFEIMNLTDFSSATIPQDEDLRRFGRRPASSKPLAMFRIREDEFLLCYDDFGLYIDKRGCPSRSPPTIEWEGLASQAAWHPPYVVLFSSAFIEVRHVESGRLAQVITGHSSHWQCLWDGRGVVHPEGADGFDDPRTPRIHAVLDESAPEMSALRSVSLSGRGRSPPKRQHVVMLAPTERLIVPGTRYSPSLLSVVDTLPPYVP